MVPRLPDFVAEAEASNGLKATTAATPPTDACPEFMLLCPSHSSATRLIAIRKLLLMLLSLTRGGRIAQEVLDTTSPSPVEMGSEAAMHKPPIGRCSVA